MISISVTSYNGAATPPLTGHFDEMGGNIGRAENNQLVLPDPERTISRVHAQVVFRNGRYAVVDRGSNPISVNGRPVGNGQEAFIQPGDELQIGGYAMRVEAGSGGAGAAAVDPFADFPGLASSPSAPGRAGAPAASFDDPLAGFGAPPRAVPASAPLFAPPASPSAGGGIPQDWDPFAPDAKPPASPNDFARSLGQGGGNSNFGLDVGGRAEALIPEFGAGGGGGGGDSLDALFGLGPRWRWPRSTGRLGTQPGRGAAEHGCSRRPVEVAQQHDARQRDRRGRHLVGAVEPVHAAADGAERRCGSVCIRAAARQHRAAGRSDSADPDFHLGLRVAAGCAGLAQRGTRPAASQ